MSSEEAPLVPFPTPTIQEFARAYKLDDEGIRFVKEGADQCDLNKEFNALEDIVWSPVNALEGDASEAFFAEFANSYIPNIARAYHYFSSGHHSESIYGSMLMEIQLLPQFSRFLREHEEGIRFVETQILLMDNGLFNIDPGSFSSEKSIRWLGSTKTRTYLLYWSISHCPPSYSLLLATPDLRKRAISLLGRISTFRADLPVIAGLHPKEDLTGLSRSMKDLETHLSPFLKGHGTAQQVRGSYSFAVWWKCSGMEHGGGCERVKDEDMLQCGKCKSVRYCSRRHQKAD